MLKLKSVIFLGLFVLLQSCSENEPFNKMKLKNGEIISVDDNSNIEQIAVSLEDIKGAKINQMQAIDLMYLLGVKVVE